MLESDQCLLLWMVGWDIPLEVLLYPDSVQDVIKQNVTLKKNCNTKIVSQDGCSFSLHTTIISILS